MKEYSIAEVNKHDSPENRVWVTYKNGVYDITDFIPLHPGNSLVEAELLLKSKVIKGQWEKGVSLICIR